MNTSKPSGCKPKILVVDDTPDNLFLMNALLEDEYEVVTAPNGEQALQIAQSEAAPELILLDIMMPEMDGYEVIRRIRAQDQFTSLPVIAVTAKAMREDRERCIAAGATDYVAKPVNMVTLVTMLARHAHTPDTPQIRLETS
jgi:CheY-like chemotaxis protein